MAVDLVVDHFADLAGHNIGDGALAWCKLDDIIAVQSELGGDWLPYLQAGAIYHAPVKAAPVGLANGASGDVTVAFPANKFTQAPRIIGLVSNTTRYSVAEKPGTLTKDGVTIRVSNFSGATSGDAAPSFRLTAIQTFV